MSSLQSIMNLDEDQQDASSPRDKKNKDQATPASAFRRQNPSSSLSSSHLPPSDQPYSSASSAPSTAVPVIQGTQLYCPAQQSIDDDPSPASSDRQGKRPAEPVSATPTLLTASPGPAELRRQSSTSVDSMDQYGYPSSSSLGGASGGGVPSNHPRRPMGPGPTPDVPVRYTPITGRVSRAKKGVPVHICEFCNPPKTFTRAEHLRRHQLSHQQPRFPCDQCDRAFHRQDLLTRHQQRHNQDGGDQGSQAGKGDRRDSEASGASGPTTLQPPYASVSGGFGGASTPSSVSGMPPGTPPDGSRSASMGMSPQPRGAADIYRPSPDQSNNYSYGMPDLRQHGNRMESSPDPPVFTEINYNMIPRTLPLFAATQGLPVSAALHTSLDHPPELVQSTDYSPWTSASESTYSTPGDQPLRRRSWRHATQNSLGWQTDPDFLSAYPNAARRGISTAEGLETMATTQYYVSDGFPISPHMASVSQHPYNSLLNDSMMAEFASDQAQPLMDPTIAGHHVASRQRSLSVRSHTPETSIATSGQMADTLVTPAPLPHRIDPMAHPPQKELVVDDGARAGQMGVLGGIPHWNGDSPGDAGLLAGAGANAGCGSNGANMLTPLPRSVRNAIPTYMNIYWEQCHAICPLVHRQAFEAQGEDVLRCAMAAFATQYTNSKEDRIRGSQLHDFAWQEAKRAPQWTLQVMQAILLCELFARFRGRKALLRSSKLFEHLYARVLEHSPDLDDQALLLNAASFEHQLPMGDRNQAKEERWRAWIETEGRRRLLAACFIVDNHASAMHQQPCARDGIDPSDIPLTGPSDALWSANSADEWLAILQSNPAAGQAHFLPCLDSLCPEEVAQYSAVDKAAILHAATLSLPRLDSQWASAGKGNENELASADELDTPTTASSAAQASKPEDRLLHLFSLDHAPAAHVYVALHHTPLHDLLAVSGESWVLSHRVLAAPTFHEHQKRLKAWVDGRSSSTSPAASPTSPITARLEGMSSAKATWHAAHALVGFLAAAPQGGAWISDYWAMYVCALIVWAVGHKAGGRPAAAAAASSALGSGGSPPPPPPPPPPPTTTRGQPIGEDEAVAWLRGVAESGAPEHVGRVRGRREASVAIVSMVKRRLEADCVGGRSRLYMDAVGVLRKLEERVSGRCF